MNLQDILAHAILGIMKSIGFALIQMNVKAIRILVDQETVSTRMEVMNAYVILFFWYAYSKLLSRNFLFLGMSYRL